MIKNKKLIEFSFIIFALLFTLTYLSNTYLINTILPLLKSLYLVLAIIIIGFYISKINKKDAQQNSLLTYTGLGLIFTVIYFYLISFFKLLNTISIGIFLFIPLLLLLHLSFDKKKKLEFYSDIIDFTKRDLFEYLLFLIPFIYASLPSTFYDTLVYHLGIPNIYLNNGGFIPTPQFMFANMSIYYEIALIPAVFLGDLVPRLFHFFLGVIFLHSIIDFGGEFFNIKKRKTLLIIILSLPLTLFLLTTVKADLISALFIFLGIKKYYKKKYFLSAIFWGFSIGVKSLSGIALIIFFVLMIIKQKKIYFKRHMFMGSISFIMLLPLLIKNYFLLKNPFFPFLLKIFPTESFDNFRYIIARNEIGSYYHSLIDILKAPFSFSFNMHGSGGIVGPLFLIFLPFLIFYKIRHKYLLFFSLLLLFIGPAFGKSFRFIYIVFIILSIFVTYIYTQQNKTILKIILYIIIFINSIVGITTLESLYSARDVYFYKKSIDKYKYEHFTTYKAYSTINHITKKTDKILIAGEGRGFYLKRPYTISIAQDYSIFKKYLELSDTKEQFFKNIKSDGFAYIIFNLKEFKRLQNYRRLNKKDENKLFDFLKNTKPFKQEKFLLIYKL